MRARHKIEEGRGDRRSIVLTSIPYQVGKNGLVEKIAEAAKDKRVEGISDIRDESNREGVRVVIDLKRDATPDVVLNQLWRHTPAQSSFPANMLAIRGGRPETLTLRDIIESFVRFREEVITRRAKFELAKARDRAHLLLGLVIAVTNLDEVVRIIRGSASPAEARAALLAREWPVAEIAPYIRLVEAVEHEVEGDSYRLSDAQVRAILELRLHRLTALGRDEIAGELQAARRLDRRPARDPRRPRQALRGDARRVRRDRRGLCDAARHRDRPRLGRDRGRGSDRARGHGRDRHPRRLHQAHPARDLPHPGARRQGPRRHGDQGRGRGHQAVRHLDPHARSCSSRPTARSIGSRSGGCPRARRRRAAGRW